MGRILRLLRKGMDFEFGKTKHESIEAEQQRVTGEQTVTIDVPSDFPTVNEALRTSGQYIPNGGIEVVVNIESGHEITDQVEATDGDYSNVTIQSEDDTVRVVSGGVSGPSVMNFERVTAPVLDTIIDCNNAEQDGLRVRSGSIVVTADGGVINANENNVYLHGAWFRASGATFSGAGGDIQSGDYAGVFADRSSRAVLSGADVSNSVFGIRISDGSNAMFRSGVANDCLRRGISANRSGRLHAQGAEANRAGENAVFASDASIVNFRNGEGNDAGEWAVRCRRGAWILSDRAEITGAASGTFYLQSGARITATDLPSSTDRDLWVEDQQTDEVFPGLGNEVTEAGYALIDGETVPARMTGRSVAFWAGLTNDQNITAEELTRIEFDSIKEDPTDAWDSDSYAYIAPRAGFYRVTASVSLRDAEDGDEINLFAGGGNASVGNDDVGATRTVSSGASRPTLTVSKIVDVNSGVEIKADVVNQTRDDRVWDANSTTYLQVEYLRDRF